MAIGNFTLVNSTATLGSGVALANATNWLQTNKWWAVLCGNSHTPAATDVEYSDLTNVLSGDGAPIHFTGNYLFETATQLWFRSADLDWGDSVTIAFTHLLPGTVYFVWAENGVAANDPYTVLKADDPVLGYITGLHGASSSKFKILEPLNGWFSLG